MTLNRAMPACSIIPELAYPDVTVAADWLCQAFGFAVRLRIGGHRVQLAFGTCALVVVNGSGGPKGGADRTHAVMVRVDDVDAHCERARAHGARILSEPTRFPYGERQYSAVDIGGHRWTFSQSVADVDPAEWGGELIL